jgi:hypothetical protein
VENLWKLGPERVSTAQFGSEGLRCGLEAGSVLGLHDQLDFVSYGLAARWAVGSRWEIVGEVAGRAGEGKPGAEERSEARLGARYTRGRLRFDAALRRGLLSEQGTWGGTVGLSWTIRPRS